MGHLSIISFAQNHVQHPAIHRVFFLPTEMIGQLWMPCIKQGIVQGESTVCTVAECLGELDDHYRPGTGIGIRLKGIPVDMTGFR